MVVTRHFVAQDSPFCRPGSGLVPAPPLVLGAASELIQVPLSQSLNYVTPGLGWQLDFSEQGVSVEQFLGFIAEAQKCAESVEPVLESGNRYSVTEDIGRVNGELLLEELTRSPGYSALGEDQTRAGAFLRTVCLNAKLRSRNPIHPTSLDSAIIGNLLNFPKHLFGFPFGCYATNGNEALSLLLVSYRRLCRSPEPCVIYVGDEGPVPDIEACALRLGMRFHLVEGLGGLQAAATRNVAVVLCSLASGMLGEVASWAAQARVALHLHVSDAQLRAVLSEPRPVHFELPAGVRSMSIEEGMFRSAFTLYRDLETRDHHMDVANDWQTYYLSPNEGGSGSSTPLYIDFCFVLLGWAALRRIAAQPVPRQDGRLQPQVLPPLTVSEEAGIPVERVMSLARADAALPRDQLERNVLQYHRHFVGGQGREVEALTSGGGTRSVLYSFEAVLARANAARGQGLSSPKSPFKVLTGNPHLVVERSAKRLQFDLKRLLQDGEPSILSVEGLRREISDQSVIAVYAQTLSYTDGITDPLPEILRVIEEENLRRLALGEASGAVPVTLINDCCLALSVLLHNDGQDGPNLRLLDLSEGCVTPVIVCLDAHKHMGADKGISMAMGTPGTLAWLRGHVRVGAQPSEGQLLRTMADLRLVGAAAYRERYRELVAELDAGLLRLEAAGLKMVHGHGRTKGSTVFALEDPGWRLLSALKRKGHAANPIFNLSTRTVGFAMSVTLYGLRDVGGTTALERFISDIMLARKECPQPLLAQFFEQDSLAAVLVSGGDPAHWFASKAGTGLLGWVSVFMSWRVYTTVLDIGVIRAAKGSQAKTILGRTGVGALVLGAAAMRLARTSKL